MTTMTGIRHTTRCVRRHLLTGVALLAIPGIPGNVHAAGQTAGDDWTRGTTLNLFAGVASGSSTTGPVAGGAVGWELTPWVTVEGNGAWHDRRRGAHAFGADLRVLVNLTATRPAVPFVQAGIGLYRASFDTSRGPLPRFYQRRQEGAGPPLQTATFTDPAIVLGGGVNVYLNRHVSIRPDVEARIVRRSGHHVVTAATVRLAYHFEDHPITPVRAR